MYERKLGTSSRETFPPHRKAAAVCKSEASRWWNRDGQGGWSVVKVGRA